MSPPADAKPTVFERIARAVKQFEKVQVVFQMDQRRDVLRAERRVTSVDDGLEVIGRDLGPRNVEAEDFESELGVREVFPVALRAVLAIDSCGQDRLIRGMSATQGNALLRAYPVVCGGNLMRQEEAPVSGEALEDDRFERELESQLVERRRTCLWENKHRSRRPWWTDRLATRCESFPERRWPFCRVQLLLSFPSIVLTLATWRSMMPLRSLVGWFWCQPPEDQSAGRNRNLLDLQVRAAQCCAINAKHFVNALSNKS